MTCTLQLGEVVPELYPARTAKGFFPHLPRRVPGIAQMTPPPPPNAHSAPQMVRQAWGRSLVEPHHSPSRRLFSQDRKQEYWRATLHPTSDHTPMLYWRYRCP